MRKEIAIDPKDKFYHTLYRGKFEKVGQDLDNKLEFCRDLVSIETAGMDAINDVHNILIISLFRSFIPTIGLELNATSQNKFEVLKRRFNWSSSYDEKKFACLLSLTKKNLNVSPLVHMTNTAKNYDNHGRLVSEEPTDEQKEWVLHKLDIWRRAR